jgi:hypothetical protein
MMRVRSMWACGMRRGCVGCDVGCGVWGVARHIPYLSFETKAISHHNFPPKPPTTDSPLTDHYHTRTLEKRAAEMMIAKPQSVAP